LPDPIAADALEVMTPERQLQVFEELNDDQASRLLTLMAPDAAADLVGHLLPDAAQRQLAYLPDERQRRVLELLSFPEDTAGGIMTNDIVVAPAEETVAQVRPLLAQQMTTPDFVYYVFVVDNLEARKLRGILTLRDLLLAKEDQRLRELMYANPLTAGPLEPAVTAARRLIDAHFAALPVVGVGGRLLGAVTVDAAMAQVAPKSWRDQAPRVFS
jgi:magnesium transporter